MGHMTFSVDSYQQARRDYGVTRSVGVTHAAEREARQTGKLNPIVDPGVDPIRCSRIRLNPHNKRWIATIGCPMDIEVSCDTTGSMGGEVDTEMAVLPDLYEAVAKVLPGYDPQLCLGIFGDYCDPFVMCRPQFEMEAPKIVNYLKEMAPQRGGCGNHGEDPQYAMFGRAYLTDAYTNKIGLKGYHFIVTDEPYHRQLSESQIKRIYGENIFENELKGMKGEIPTVEQMVKELKKKTHQFVLVLDDYGYDDTLSMWRDLCGKESVIVIRSTRQLPEVISTIIGLTEGTIDITDVHNHLSKDNQYLEKQLAGIAIGAQAELRHAMEHPVPKAGDIFLNKGDVWPATQDIESDGSDAVAADDPIEYL